MAVITAVIYLFSSWFQGNIKIVNIKCILIGLLVLSLSIFRNGIYYVRSILRHDIFAYLIHDYFAALTTIVWLVFFWWFSYRFVLENQGIFIQNLDALRSLVVSIGTGCSVKFILVTRRLTASCRYGFSLLQ